MGLDFARSATGKACPKRWNGEANKLKIPTLFDLTITEKDRVVTASLNAGAQVRLGGTLIVHAVESNLIICEGYKEIGRVDNPSDCVLQSVVAGCGIAEGVVERIGLFGNSMELSLK